MDIAFQDGLKAHKKEAGKAHMNVPKNHFAILNKELIETVRCWRNKPRVRNNMISTDEITAAQQLLWYEKLQNDPTRLYFVYHQGGRPVGVLDFTEITGTDCNWGCYLGEEAVWPGSGLLLEIAALDYACSHLALDCLNAEVFEFNTPAIKMHQVFEYSFVGKSETTYLRNGTEFHLLKYRYLTKEWSEKRDRVLGKLPKQIQAAAATMSFEDRG